MVWRSFAIYALLLAMLKVRPIAKIPEFLRNAYLGSLSEPQELYVETLVQTGKKLLICDSERWIGYAIIHDAAIVEFFLLESGSKVRSEAFDLALSKSGAVRALCKTFDCLMLAAAAAKPARTRTVGLLFRRIVDASFANNPEVVPRVASKNDVAMLLSVHDGFFDGSSEIESYMTEGGLFIYESKDKDVLGCGVFKRVIPGRNAFDVGMVVAAAHRRKGTGTYIVAHLKNHCLSAGYRPVCGCSASNIASQRSLEKAGFVANHSLIEFAY